MASKSNTLHPEEVVDHIVAELKALPKREQREAFFRELAALPLHTRERMDLARWRPLFAPGPYRSDEWETLSGFVWPKRPLSESEAAAIADHSVALRLREERLAALHEVRAEYEALRKRRTARQFYSAATKDQEMSATVELGELQTKVRIAEEMLEEANRFEVLARVHQDPRHRGAARNFLRSLGLLR